MSELRMYRTHITKGSVKSKSTCIDHTLRAIRDQWQGCYCIIKDIDENF